MKTKYDELLSTSLNRIKIDYSTKKEAEEAAQRLHDKFADNGGVLHLQEISLIMTVVGGLKRCGWTNMDDMCIEKSKFRNKWVLCLPRDLVLLDSYEEEKDEK